MLHAHHMIKPGTTHLKTSLNSKVFKIATVTNNWVKCKITTLKGRSRRLSRFKINNLFHTIPHLSKRNVLKNKNKNIHSNKSTVFITYWSRLKRRKREHYVPILSFTYNMSLNPHNNPEETEVQKGLVTYPRSST